ncbi:MAG: hypothetical protein IPJ83_17330 [Saprospiraceae bacterium]|nr:hypothetical protein [Candidatus Vicinibacter proximus]
MSSRYNFYSSKRKIIKRVYYFRKLVGIDSKIDLIDSWSSWCQEAALIMKANNSLNHYPPSNSKCYTDGGAIAARQSNLSLGSFGSNSIDNQIKDFGANNYGVGHRRWILYPSLEGFAVGSTDRSMVLMHDGSYKDPIPYPDFISYPSPGYFPKSLIFNNLRWSFSKKDADFSKVKIEILDESNRIIPFTLEADDKFLPVDNTIVFIPQIGTINFGRDYLFSISIKNVLVAGVMKSFDYKVLLIDPYANITTIIKEPDCTKSNGTIKLTSNLGYKSIKWNNGVTGKDSITNLSAGKYTVTITDKFDNQITREIVLNNKSSNPPKFTYTCDSILCKYDTSCRIKLGNGFKSYLWNTGETKSDIIISTNSNYFVTVTDVNNCQFILKSRPTIYWILTPS